MIAALPTWLWRKRVTLAGWASVAVFALLAGRFWHPYYGFTAFIQLDEANAKIAIREVREHPTLYRHPTGNVYDGVAYAQIAFHPLLDSPELDPAIANLPYRARRILLSALAFAFAGGQPDRIAHVYAALNLGIWLALAWLAWRLIDVRDARGVLAWLGVVFAAGALHSVRLALTDLLATTLLAAALMLHARGRPRVALAVLALAGLARETVLLGVVAFWSGPWQTPRAWLTNLARSAAAAAPLALWMLHVRAQAGPGDEGFGNFAVPLVAYVEKWSATLAGFARHPDFRWLVITTLLAIAGLTVQAIYFVRRARPDDAWWRLGAVHVALLACLGTAVWEGFPGAATRVLLPLGLAFAVLAARNKASFAWLLGGGLTVFSGVLALWHLPRDAREVAAGRFSLGAFVARSGEGWFASEHNRHDVWAWSPGRATLTIETSPRVAAPLAVQLDLRAISPRPVEIRQGAALLWRGEVGRRRQWIDLAGVRAVDGRVVLELDSPAPPVQESAAAGARALGFAVYGIRLQ